MKPIMKSEGVCEYCTKPGTKWIGPEDGVEEDKFICQTCLHILKNPQTALPFLRGHLSQELRGKIPQDQLDIMLNKFMEAISKFHPRN